MIRFNDLMLDTWWEQEFIFLFTKKFKQKKNLCQSIKKKVLISFKNLIWFTNKANIINIRVYKLDASKKKNIMELDYYMTLIILSSYLSLLLLE